MNRWLIGLRDVYLRQLLRGDGCGAASTELCPGCRSPSRPPRFRCRECAGGLLFCQECCVQQRAENPLHKISVRSFTLGGVSSLIFFLAGVDWCFLCESDPEGPWAANSIWPLSWEPLRHAASGPRRLCRPARQWHPRSRRGLLWLRGACRCRSFLHPTPSSWMVPRYGNTADRKSVV